MTKQLILIALIEQLKQLPAPTDTDGEIDFFDPPDMTLEQQQRRHHIAHALMPMIKAAFDTENHRFLDTVISLLAIEPLLQLFELALAYSDMSLKTHDYFLKHERFSGYYLCWSQVGVAGQPDHSMLYSCAYEGKKLITQKVILNIKE